MIAFRSWMMRDDELSSLTGMAAEDGGWASSTAIARCVDPFGRVDMAPRPTHPAPAAGCTCGLYAYYRPVTEMFARPPIPFPLFPGDRAHEMVFGAVEVAGRVILATRGLKAERMRILGLVIPDAATAQRMAARYNVLAYSSPGALLADFPPQDFSALVDVDNADIVNFPPRIDALSGLLSVASTRRSFSATLTNCLSTARRGRPRRRKRWRNWWTS